MALKTHSVESTSRVCTDTVIQRRLRVPFETRSFAHGEEVVVRSSTQPQRRGDDARSRADECFCDRRWHTAS
jgi:hypothetical protein